jgi:hypothetical protein
MIDMASRTEPTAISPSCTEFGVSCRPQGRLLDVLLGPIIPSSRETSLCLFSRIVFLAGQNPKKEPLLFSDDFMISRSFFELKLQELKVRIVFRDEFGGEEEKQWY